MSPMTVPRAKVSTNARVITGMVALAGRRWYLLCAILSFLQNRRSFPNDG